MLSDVHLSQAHPIDPNDPLWMRYRARDRHPDPDFAALVDELLERCAGDRLELCFNGDVLDFDAPWVKNGDSSFDELPRDEAACAAQASRILADHEPWFRAVARVLLAGHEITFVSGNHDVELYWPRVRAVLRAEIRRLVALEAERLWRAGGDDARGLPASELHARVRAVTEHMDERVRFRAWFHITEDRIYLEHGSQYDPLNGVRHPMLPVTRDRAQIHPQCGKLAFHRTGARLGYLNPYDERTFYLGLFGYLAHYVRHYALTRRHIVRVWLTGSVSTALDILRHRSFEDRTREGHALACAETGASLEQVRATYALRAPLGEDTMLPILRELWLDRALLAAVSIVVFALSVIAGGAVGAAVVGLSLFAFFAAYEALTPKPDVRTYDEPPPSVRALFAIHGVRAIAMGHTHRPFGVFCREGFQGNSGSWCPAYRDAACTEPVLDGRPFLWLTTEGDALSGGLFFFRGGRIERSADAVRSSSSPVRAAVVAR